MDPNAAWKKIAASLKQGKPLVAIDAAIDLGGWLNSGGFLPKIGVNDRPFRTSTKNYVWAVLHFMYDLDPHDELRENSTD